MKIKKYCLLVFSAVLLMSGCVSTNIPKLNAHDSQQSLLTDEKEIWEGANRFEALIADSKWLVDDAPLNAYLLTVLTELHKATKISEELFEPRVYIMNSVDLNAFVLPNGAVFITTGLLSRMDNSAQLATLLGHELVHFVNRHSLRQVRKQENSMKVAGFFNLLLSMGTGVPNSGGGFGDVVQASILGDYSRDLETEADIQGLGLMVNAGYDPQESPNLFKLLMERTADEEDAKAFASHPKLQDRIDSYELLLNNEYLNQGGVSETENYTKLVEKITYEFANREISLGLYKEAERTLELAESRYTKTGAWNYSMFQLHTQNPDSEVSKDKVESYLLSSVVQLNSPAEAFREAGFLYRRNSDMLKSSNMFRRYLELKPEAVDRMVIQSFIQ